MREHLRRPWNLVLPIAAALLALATVPCIAQQRTNYGSQRGSIVRQSGILSAIDVRGSSVTLTLEGGATITVPKERLKIVDRRGGKHKRDVVTSLAADQKVIVRTRTNGKGEILFVKVKITE